MTTGRPERRARGSADIRRFALGLFVCMGLASGPGFTATYSEAAVKAAFLHRFAAYVEWPSPAEEGPFVIGVLGADSVASELERLLPGLTIQGRRAVVRKIERVANLTHVRILYVGPGQLPRAADVLSAASARQILLVTDDGKGLAHGGVINFIRVARTVRFEVSLTSAKRSGLKINSGLLSVAARIEGRPQARLACPDVLGFGICLTPFARRNFPDVAFWGNQQLI